MSLPGTKYQDEIIGYYYNKKRRVSYNNDYYVANSIYENSYLKGKEILTGLLVLKIKKSYKSYFRNIHKDKIKVTFKSS